MQKLNVTLELDEEEVDTLGGALEIAIKFYLADSHNKKSSWVDYDIADLRRMLYDLTNAGYSLWLNADNRTSIHNGKLTIDVDAWIAHQKKLLKVRDPQ